MDTKTCVVGQDVYVAGSFGPVEGKIVHIAPPCIYVATAEGPFRFNSDGRECDLNGKAYTYENNIMLGPGPCELKSVEEVHFARNITNWLIGFLKDGGKPTTEISIEAEKKFGAEKRFGNVWDWVQSASHQLNVSWSLPRDSRVSVSASGRCTAVIAKAMGR
jgi:hypothetical protein